MWQVKCPYCSKQYPLSGKNHIWASRNFTEGINFAIIVCSYCLHLIVVRSTGDSKLLESSSDEEVCKQWMNEAEANRGIKPLHPLIEVLP